MSDEKKLETINETTNDNNIINTANFTSNEILIKLEEIYKYIKSVHG